MRRIVAALAIAASPLLASEQVERDLALPLPLFSAASPWNQRADTAAVAPDSEAQVLVLWRVLLGDATTVTPREAVPASPFPFPRVSSAEYGVPLARAGRGTIEIPLGDHARDPRGALLAGLILPEDIELELIPLAAGSWRDYGSGGNDARTAGYSRANFEIVEPAGVVPRRRRLVRRDTAPAWRPAAGTSWQIQLDGTLDTTVEATLWEIDAADHDAATVAALHAAGAKVICYVNAGAWEEWRSDAAQFPPSVIGKEYAGWPGERWLDIRRLDVLGPILEARLDVCAGKGFDAADPDNLDGYQQDTGFPLTAADQLAFNRFLAREAHERGLAIALKNDFDQAAALEPDFDFAVTESCFHYGECTALQPFLDRGKAVLAIEYTDTGATLESFCSEANRLGISAILKNRLLDAWRGTCP